MYESTTSFVALVINDRCLTITLNRPDAMNALRPEMLETLANTFEQAATDESLSVIVLRGAGRAFSAGVDLKVLQGINPQAGKIGELFDQPAERMVKAMQALPIPVIAQVHGACFTGALEIALHCDFIYATADTKFGDTHAKFGLRPTWGMPQTLSRAVGIRRARELSFSARTISGTEAKEWGLVNEVYDSQETMGREVVELAERIAANSRAAIAAMRDMYAIAARELGLAKGLNVENAQSYPAITDTKERLSGFGR
jgi:enoyl-CoA hydratase